MQSTATKLRIKFNKIRRAARWKKPNARYILIGRDLREPTPVPWQPLLEERYTGLADFMKRGWRHGRIYAVPMRGRQPGEAYSDLMERLTLKPADDVSHEALLGLKDLDPFSEPAKENRTQMYAQSHANDLARLNAALGKARE